MQTMELRNKDVVVLGLGRSGMAAAELLQRDGARVVVDPISLGFVRGSEIDFVDELIGAQFKINNPNVTASCGCGTSFSI